MKPLVIFHKGCFDGTGSALVAWLVFGEKADYLPLSYSDQPPQPSQVLGRDVYLIDFSFKPGVMESLVAASKTFTWLDHHKSAKEELGAFVASQYPCMSYEDGKFGANLFFGGATTNFGYFDCPQDAIARARYVLEGALDSLGRDAAQVFDQTMAARKFRCVVDMERSGATIAWGYFFPDKPVSEFFKMIEDRDLWRNTMAGVEEFHSYLFTLGFDDPRKWDSAIGADETIMDLIEKGRVARAAKKMDIELALRYSAPLLFEDTYEAQVVNFPLHQGDVGHELVKLSKGGVGVLYWFDHAKGQYIVSLRSSNESGVDVAKIAQRYGGGGHVHASGFQCTELPWRT